MHIPRILRTSRTLALIAFLIGAAGCIHAQHDETVPVTSRGGGPAPRHINCMAPGATLRGCD